MSKPVFAALFAAVVVAGLHAAPQDGAMLAPYAASPKFLLTMKSDLATKVFSIHPVVYGPGWAYTLPAGKVEPFGEGGAEAKFSGKMGGTENVTYEGSIRVEKEGARTLRFSGEFSASADTDLVMAALLFDMGGDWRGAGRLTFVDAEGAESVLACPPNNSRASAPAKSMRLRDAAGRELGVVFGQAAQFDNFGEKMHWHIAAGNIRAEEPRAWSFTVALPFDVDIVPTVADLPMPADIDRWFAWTAASDTGPSVVGAESLLEAPAGKHGRIRVVGDKLMYNGKPFKIWGINNGARTLWQDWGEYDKRAEFYAKHGINAIRMHKYADGTDGVLSAESSVVFGEDPKKGPALDHYVKAMKDRGIYTKLSINFGNTRIGPADRAKIPFVDEMGRPDGKGWQTLPHAATWLLTEVQDIQIGCTAATLDRVNTATGIRYADDPAVFLVEIVNENCAFFHGWGGARNCPPLKQRAGEMFRDWLHAKYGTEEKLLAAWGPTNYNGVPCQGTEGESWDGVIYPAGHPWYWDNLNPGGNPAVWDVPLADGKGDQRWPRLLDAALFWCDVQNAVYDRAVAAFRALGYDGEIMGSNWHAGTGVGHYLNLLSDGRIGLIDRHNYHADYWSMFSRPGSSILSTGLTTQLDNRPFMISEWIHEMKAFHWFGLDPALPRAFDIASEGPLLYAAYGMGLNGWDGSFIFAGDQSVFSAKIDATWDPHLPSVLGLFPALSRMALRDDVAESKQLFTRNIDMASLQQGRLGFGDTLESHGYDNRHFSSGVLPEQLLAVGRVVVKLNDEPTPTPAVDPAQFIKNGRYVSATGELSWRPGETIRDGDVTINTPFTQALCGFTQGKPADLADVAFRTDSPYAILMVTSLDNEKPVASAKNLLVTALARIRNTNQRFAGQSSLDWGTAPILLEPVVAEITLKRPGNFTVHILDQDGRRTGNTLAVAGRVIKFDTAVDKTIYYEVEFD